MAELFQYRGAKLPYSRRSIQTPRTRGCAARAANYPPFLFFFQAEVSESGTTVTSTQF
jgi:hypothetical protein